MIEPELINEGKKYTHGKPDWSILPLDVLPGVISVFQSGKLKYGGSRTWLPGIVYSKLFSASMRHMVNWFFCGQDKDVESGEHPLCHVIANCLMLLTFVHKSEFDDRPAVTKKNRDTT